MKKLLYVTNTIVKRYCISFSCNFQFQRVLKHYNSNRNLSSMTSKKPFERLPRTVLPKIYDIFLKPDLKTFKFQGIQTVQIQISKPTERIIFNTTNLSLNAVKLNIKEVEFIPQIIVCDEENTTTLLFTETLPIGNAELFFNFTGELSDKLKGFYRCEYTSTVGETAYMATTQFEATDARRCFPCWDEPDIKASFDITVAVDPDVKTTLSNMPIQSEYINEDGKKIVKFERTPVMSTYLVAIVVGNFDYVEDKTTDGIVVRVYTPVGKKEQGRFALHVATKVLPYYKEYFQIAYPLPKMDLIAIPVLEAGAMENWGLVTFREDYLLVDNENSTAITKQMVAIVIGHELAHQWFGNLVTMKWWTDLWLNEGYASFVEFLCVDYLFPEMEIWTQFVTETYCRALELDSLHNSHPIEVPVNNPSEIDEIFDEISYSKGASVIRMLHHYIGDEAFRKGMNLYLTKHQYGNTVTDDLWTSLEKASSKPVRMVMTSWTKQMGFPVISVEQVNQIPENKRTLKLSQTKFSLANSGYDEKSLWQVPISFSKSSDAKKEFFSCMLDTKSCDVILENVSPDEWVKINPGAVGFYRVKYSSSLLNNFAPSVKDRTLPPLDRLGLLDDLLALVQTGQTNTVEVLKFMQVMTDEDNYTVWMNICVCLGKIQKLLANTDIIDLFHDYGLRIVKPVIGKLGYDAKPGEGHLDTLLRTLILTKLVSFGDKDFVKEAEKRLDEHKKGACIITPNLRSSIYKAVVSTGNEEAYDTLIEMYRQTDLLEERERIIKSFTAIAKKEIVDKALEFAQSSDVSAPNFVQCISSIAFSKAGRIPVWNFVKENWDELYKKYKGGFLINSIVKNTTDSFTSESMAKEIETFFSNKSVEGAERALQQSLETIRINAAWLQRDEQAIKDFLIAQN